MQTNRYKYFRWTARTGWLTVAYVVAFPAFIGYMAMATDVSRILFPRLLSHKRKKAGAGAMQQLNLKIRSPGTDPGILKMLYPMLSHGLENTG